MPDKLTDEKCKELLEYKAKVNCEMCDLKGKGSCITCTYNLIKQFLEIFNRLQAENERLKGHQKDGFFNLLGNCLVFSKTLKDYNDMRKGLKAEAYKEFVDLLKAKADELQQVLLDGKWAISQYDIDKLLKEKVGSDLF